jgi:VIT1/CCC1 family predicted Fe2+/Mn2+ transporter
MEKSEIHKNNDSTVSTINQKNIIHPFSALLTLLFDLFFFGADAATLGLDLPVSVTSAFLLTFFSTFIIQKKISKDKISISFTKSIILAILAAIPTPIAGTAVGMVLLTSAGIKKIKTRNHVK